MSDYRKNVAAIVLNEKNQILIFERSDLAGWGFPQGGIEEGEDTEIALVRELGEEIGIKPEQFDIIAKAPEKIRYDFPAELTFKSWTYKGQEQQYYLVKLRPNTKIDLTSFPEEIEFLSYRAVNLEELKEVDFGFKKEVYAKALEYFKEDLCQ